MKHESPLADPLSPEVAASTFAALGSEQRLDVLRTLVRAGPEGLSIGELGQRCGVTGSTLTHHMKILAAAKLVSQEKQGRSIICVAADIQVMQSLTDYLLNECCADCAPEKAHNHG
ncbi:metalloregulator ArsR/SmtB family transcription factor [Aliiroseovarius subalbicans]|uniref:ArsR/SmtB family transcription factor n=1 Tax=Aliiroseovarius subalbicans TaxID=2925840 RepID=UPI001F55E9B1|nr:metalloregulator ArsR/SmtB family transcription factor [Aliiroseovarius subalbicans]MCI2400802.1 metalloregulator ArsR/SmtB family transcription factor [Aliiroseovarius subalbicans]